MVVAEAPPEREPLCEWIEPALRESAGQDPLGLQTITTDRILPGLLPGVLSLTARARYLSFYAFLLRRYEQSSGRADNHGLDDFLRRREFELCVAANLCTECEAEDAIGNRVARPLAGLKPASYERQWSVKSELGGYGLYYRSPMEELGIVVRRGQALVGDEPNPIDVLDKTPRAQGLAERYEEAIADTRWYRDWMHGVDPIPAEVLEELAEAGCLCRLAAHPRERDTIRQLLLSSPSVERAEAAEARRQAFALLLDFGRDEPEVLRSDDRFRDRTAHAFLRDPRRDDARGRARARWASAAMRECVQDTLSTIWHSVCQVGLTIQPFDGLNRRQLDDELIPRLLGDGLMSWAQRTVTCRAADSAADWAAQLVEASDSIGWELLRRTAAEGDALDALGVLVVLCLRALYISRAAGAWLEVAQVSGDHQPGLLRMAELVDSQLRREPTVAGLMRWVVDNFIVSVHESVAMAKLPESTFRFYAENGRLRFVDNGVGRFQVSGLRRNALASLAYDLGWWELHAPGGLDEERPIVTSDGAAVIEEVFGR